MAKPKCDVDDCDESAVEQFVIDADGATVSRCAVHSIPPNDRGTSWTPKK